MYKFEHEQQLQHVTPVEIGQKVDGFRERAAEAVVRAALWNNIDSLQAAVQDLEIQVRTDNLTGINSLYAFNVDLEERFNANRRPPSYRQVSLAYVDLDAFKSANDRYGHGFGDKLLKRSAVVMGEHVKPFGNVYRIGGDEFAILFHRLKEMRGQPEKVMRDIADLIEDRIEQDYKSSDLYREDLPFGASVGIVRSEPGETPEELKQRADHAMYIRKGERKAFREI